MKYGREGMRSGITLMITLSVIAAMLALLGVLFGYLDKARESALRKGAMIEASMLRSDIAETISKSLGGKADKDRLTFLYSMPVIVEDPGGDFTVSTECSPYGNRLEISWLGGEGKKSLARQRDLAEKVFEYLSSEAELRDAGLLRELIVGALSGKGAVYGGVRTGGGNGGVLTRDLWYAILDEYRYEADDPNVYGVEWERYFRFGKPLKEGGRIDAEFISPYLLAFLYNLEVSFVESDFKQGELDTFLGNIGRSAKEYEWLFADGPLEVMECKADFIYGEKNYRVSFQYNNGKVYEFGFFEEK